MRLFAFGLDFRPPDAAMAEADTVLVERLGDDDVVDTRLGEIALAREMGDAAESARFFVHRAGYLYRAREIRIRPDEGLDGYDRGGEPALHVARAAAIDAAVSHHALERIDGPAVSRLDHVDMRVEMHAGAWAFALSASDHIGTRIAVCVARFALATNIFDVETGFRQSVANEFCARRVGFTRRIDRRKADQVAGELNEVVLACGDRFQHGLHGGIDHELARESKVSARSV